MLDYKIMYILLIIENTTGMPYPEILKLNKARIPLTVPDVTVWHAVPVKMYKKIYRQVV